MTMTKTLALVAAVLLLAGCAGSPPAGAPADSADSALLAAYDLAGLDGKEIVERLEHTPVGARHQHLRASVRPGHLLLSEAGSDAEIVVDLPDDEFYLSIAPYRERTHDCYFHSLTTCRGEMAGKQVHVRITDRASGAVLVNETVRMHDHGFVGFWLPSNIEAVVEISHDGYAGSQIIATRPDDPTCLSTLQLQPAT